MRGDSGLNENNIFHKLKVHVEDLKSYDGTVFFFKFDNNFLVPNLFKIKIV